MAVSLIPKGNPFHEIINLPSYWLELSRIDISGMQESKISYGDHHRQYFLYIPPPPEAEINDKIVVYFHGGGWKFGKPELFKPSIKTFHDAGYPVILPSVRRTPYYNYYDMREDLNLLTLKIRELQRQYQWEDKRLLLSGMSAGGNLAALLCFDHHQLSELDLSPSFFAGLFVLGAPLDLEHMQDSLLLRAFAGTRESEQFRLANPMEHWRRYQPATPVFCVHGQCDGLVAYQSALAFVRTFENLQPEKIQFVSSESGTHLDAAAWGHNDIELKREILAWLKKL